MNPAITTLLTLLQWAGYLLVYLIVLSTLTYAIRSTVREYWAGKTTCLSMTRQNAPDVATLYQAAMDVRNGKHTVEK